MAIVVGINKEDDICMTLGITLDLSNVRFRPTTPLVGPPTLSKLLCAKNTDVLSDVFNCHV